MLGVLSIKAEDTVSVEVWGKGIDYSSERDWETFFRGSETWAVDRWEGGWGFREERTFNMQGVLWMRIQGSGIESMLRHSVCYTAAYHHSELILAENPCLWAGKGIKKLWKVNVFITAKLSEQLCFLGLEFLHDPNTEFYFDWPLLVYFS